MSQRITYADEFIDYMGDYFKMRVDIHGKVTFEQFIRAPLRFQWIPPLCEEKERVETY
jgi:hypothetical protein